MHEWTCASGKKAPNPLPKSQQLLLLAARPVFQNCPILTAVIINDYTTYNIFHTHIIPLSFQHLPKTLIPRLVAGGGSYHHSVSCLFPFVLISTLYTSKSLPKVLIFVYIFFSNTSNINLSNLST